MKNCTTCGAELQPHWKFCTNCQAPQPSQDVGASAGPGESVSPEGAPASAAEQRDEQPTQRFEQAPATSVFDPPVVAPAAAFSQTGAAQSNQAPAGAGSYGPGAGAAPAGFNAGGNGPAGPGNGPEGPNGNGPDGGNSNGPAGNGPNGNGPMGPGFPPSGPEAPKKRSRKTIILVVVLVILLGLGIGAYFFVQNLFRGGAGSPEAASDKLLESIETKDLVGLVGMVPPNEREPLQRLQEHLSDKFDEFEIEDALEKAGRGDEADEDEFTLDGINVTFSGVKPEITEIDGSTALIKYTEGEVRVEVDPDATTGQLRSLLEATGNEDEEKIDETTELSEIGPDGSALTLMATERDGRWYISPVYSVAEMISESEGFSRGTVPESAGGSDSPAEAAKAMVEAVPEVVSEGSVEPLAGSLSVHEGGLLYLYGEMFDDALSGLSGEDVKISDVKFTEGDKDGDRAVAVVENITIESEYGDEINVTKDCIKGESESDSFCLNGSGYSIDPSPYMLGGLKELSLTTVKEDGKWRVSMGETFTDWVIKWTDSLTREQALALLSLAATEEPTADITLDEATEVEFNSAGYAVLGLSLDKTMELEAEDEYGYGTMTVYSADGKEEIGVVGWGDEIPAGDYKLVVFAGYEWDEEFAENGSDPGYSKELTLIEDPGYSPSTSPESATPSPSEPSQSPSAEDTPDDFAYDLLMPGETQTQEMGASKGEADAVITMMGSPTSDIVVGVTLDGEEHKLEIPKGETGSLSIPYPNDGKGHTMTVRMIDGGDSSMMLSYGISISPK